MKKTYPTITTEPVNIRNAAEQIRKALGVRGTGKRLPNDDYTTEMELVSRSGVSLGVFAVNLVRWSLRTDKKPRLFAEVSGKMVPVSALHKTRIPGSTPIPTAIVEWYGENQARRAVRWDSELKRYALADLRSVAGEYREAALAAADALESLPIL
jgi:hypothetical protein